VFDAGARKKAKVMRADDERHIFLSTLPASRRDDAIEHLAGPMQIL